MIQKELVEAIDLAPLRISQAHTAINWDEFLGPVGKEHYKLLAYFASQVNGATILDIGTHRGASALALSYNTTNQIHSFDIVHSYPLPKRDNIQFHKEDLFDPAVRAEWSERILGSAFIFLDIDPHEGTREFEFLSWLEEQSYKGFVICDDIWYFKPMRDNFWYRVDPKYREDLTSLGHWSGTGIIRFSETEASQASSKSWTVVTAYFDLTKMPDASRSIKARDAAHYLANARSTMAVTQPLVVFCEPDAVEALRAMRPPALAEKTQYIPMSFEDFPLTKYREKIIQNRKEKPYSFDDRNTASYYLLCMARYAMLKRVIVENPFETTHVCWLNICIERMGWRNVAALESVWATGRDKFSTCWIDYQPEPLVRDMAEYFKWGRCGMCSGFFTGRRDYMMSFCDEMKKKFLLALQAGYGHADEQLFSMVYFDRPEIFEPYYGDYQQMVTNYVEPVDRPFEPVRLLATHAAAHGNWPVALKALEAVWGAWKKGSAGLDDSQLKELVRLLREARGRLGMGSGLP